MRARGRRGLSWVPQPELLFCNIPFNMIQGTCPLKARWGFFWRGEETKSHQSPALWHFSYQPMPCENSRRKVCPYTPGHPAATQAQAKASGCRWGQPTGWGSPRALPALGKGCPRGQAGAGSAQGFWKAAHAGPLSLVGCCA